MGHFYQLVAKTQYLDPDNGTVDHPPSTDPEQSINTTLVDPMRYDTPSHPTTAKASLRRSASDMERGADKEELIRYGRFAGFRKEAELEEPRDPLYAGVESSDEGGMGSPGWDHGADGQYMQPSCSLGMCP